MNASTGDSTRLEVSLAIGEACEKSCKTRIRNVICLVHERGPKAVAGPERNLSD